MKTLAILLIILGVLAVGYQGFTYVTREKVIDIGPIKVTKENHKRVFLHPVVGAVAVAAGIALLLTTSKRA